MKLVYDRRLPRAWREGVIGLITRENGRKGVTEEKKA